MVPVPESDPLIKPSITKNEERNVSVPNKLVDRIVRLNVELPPSDEYGDEQPMIISYHYEYKKYLNDNNLGDVLLFLISTLLIV